MATTKGVICWLACMATAFVAGCQRATEQVAVSGAISFDGQPVADGQVAFEPVGPGKMQFATITDGRYSLPAEYGLTPGEYLVRITGNRSTGRKADADALLQSAESLDIVEQYIPLKYNSGSQLKTTIKAEDRVERNFELQGK